MASVTFSISCERPLLRFSLSLSQISHLLSELPSFVFRIHAHCDILRWSCLFLQGVSGNEARMTSMTRLFESPRVADLPDIRVRANQYRSALEPEEYVLTPLAAAAIFSRNLVIEALLADPAVKVRGLFRRVLRVGGSHAAWFRCPSRFSAGAAGAAAADAVLTFSRLPGSSVAAVARFACFCGCGCCRGSVHAAKNAFSLR